MLLVHSSGASPKDCSGRGLESGRPLAAGLPGGPWATLGSEAESKALDRYLDIFSLFEGPMSGTGGWSSVPVELLRNSFDALYFRYG